MLGFNLFGYIDPASGFIILQVIVSGIVGCAVFFRNTFMKAVRFVTGRGKKEEAAPGTPQSPVVAPAPALVDEKLQS